MLIVQNLSFIFAIVVSIATIVLLILNWRNLSPAQRYELIRGWLLQAVMIAERDFGPKTGKLKLSAVYDKFCERFPWLAKVIPFAKFSQYVDDALVEAKSILESNQAIANVVGVEKEEKTQ